MKKAIDFNGNEISVTNNTPVNTIDGVHYLLTTQQEQEAEDKRVAWEAGANAREWAKIREKREELLKESDWTQFSDSPKKDQQSIKDYRQALRDITDQADPFNITWPTEPEGI